MKKKLIFVVVILLTMFFNIRVNASSYIVMDQNSGRVLMGNDYNESSLIASITKIMTAIITIENIDINKEVEVTEEVLKAYGSAIYIEVGEKLTIKDLLYGLMLRSGNDAAIVLAESVSGSMEEFVLLMNQKVKDLKLENTNFVNNHGLEEKDGANYSSSYDMALITKYAMENEIFREIFGTENYKTESSYKTYSWENKNRILHSHEYITGGKTGYTIKAGRTLVTTGSKDNMDIIVVTIRDGNDFSNHINYYESVFKNYEAYKVLDKNLFSLSVDENIYIEEDYYALIKKGDEDNLKIEYDLYKNPDDKIAGKVKVYYMDEIIYESKLLKKVEEKESWWDKLLGWFKSW